jgi:UDPglucose--hexose-1-phosphate uridylyltransferase
MPELRQDPSTRDWVVIAPHRSSRPHSFRGPNRAGSGLNQADRSCPFCPGHEAETPPEVWRISGTDGRWRVRVVPNQFPVLVPDGTPSREVSPAGLVSMAGTGHHEVIIESPEHTADLARAEHDVVRTVLEAYRARYRALRDHATGVILLFRNHGPGAGTSLAHPHSQIVATPVVPIQVRHRFEVAMQHYDDLGTCLYLDILDRELRDGRRVVLESERFVAFQPFASAAPFETWIMPRRHQASFGAATDAALDDLAPVLGRVLEGLSNALDDPDYNAVVQSAPVGDEHLHYFVWHVRIVPRLATPAGFELGSGMAVNSTCPEDTAALLRAAIARQHVPATE